MSVLSQLVGTKDERSLKKVRLSELSPNPNQPRKYFSPESLSELAESITQYGILNPLTVRRRADGSYELIAGERRMRAARLAGLTEVPCLVITADDAESSAIALVENLQRFDLDFFEEAAGFRRLIDEFGLTQEEAARRVGKTQSSVANKLRLLKLDARSVALIRDAALTERHARALLRLPTDEQRVQALTTIISHEWNVSRTEQYIDSLLDDAQPKSQGKMLRLIRDVRFFLNTLNRAVGVMVEAGVGATVEREETETDMTLTIHIPNAKG